MSHEQFEEAVALYAVEALEPHERQEVEAHLRTGCEECWSALKEYQAATGLIPYALPPVEVPFDLKSHLMRTFELDSGKAGAPSTPTVSLGRSRKDAPRSPSIWPSWLGSPALAFVLIVLLVGVSLYAFALRSQMTTETGQRRQLEAALQTEGARLTVLQQQATEQEKKLAGLKKDLADKLGETRDTLAARESELAQLRTQIAQRTEEVKALNKALFQKDPIAAFLRSPDIQVVFLAGSEEAKSAGGLLLYDPDTKRALFYAFNMPPLPEGKTYQLWAILDKPISAGTFGTDSGNKSRALIRRVPEVSLVKKFAVSLEPEGGQPHPTGQIYLSGQF